MSYQLGIGNYNSTVPCVLPPSLTQQTSSPGGLGCACNGTCGSCWQRGSLGLGLFDSGLDWTQWGIGEWATIALGGWALMSMMSSGKRAASGIAALAPTKKGRSRRRKRARIREEAREAGLL